MHYNFYPLFLLLLLVSSPKITSTFLSNEPWENYDMYVLSVQWGSTICLTKGKICYEKFKQIPKHSMSLHGLWPSLSTGVTLPDCNSEEQIDIIDNGSETFLNMRKYWPSLTGTNKEFWDHEYNKHGFCYNLRNEQMGENYEYYFKKVLDIFLGNKIDSLIIDICSDADDGEYVLPDDFKEKMDEKFGENTYSLRCTKIGGNYYLQEIRFKLDLDFNFTDKGKSQNSCPINQYINVVYDS